LYVPSKNVVALPGAATAAAGGGAGSGAHAEIASSEMPARNDRLIFVPPLTITSQAEMARELLVDVGIGGRFAPVVIGDCCDTNIKYLRRYCHSAIFNIRHSGQLGAKVTRCYTELPAKDYGQMTLISEARLQRDHGEGLIGSTHQGFRSFDPLLHDVTPRSDADG
jgi:hypothetical protein